MSKRQNFSGAYFIASRWQKRLRSDGDECIIDMPEEDDG
jgi:hypothetical protein